MEIRDFVETLHILKKKEYVDRRGFHPLPALPHIRYPVAGFNWGIQEYFRDFDSIHYPNRGSHSSGAEPREREQKVE
ncbi:MAG: hypothetical protein WCP36_02315 [Methanomicrobiales archaeon]